jgi:hypothetical protein
VDRLRYNLLSVS